MARQRTAGAFLLLWLAIEAASAQDLHHVTPGFEFIYHQYADLFLTVHNDTACYFSHVPKNVTSQISLNYLQPKAANTIVTKDSTRLSPTTLHAVRNAFEDRLADYHCIAKDVYMLELMSDHAVCSFSTDLCGFTQDTTDNLDWSVGSGAARADNSTGPVGDHTPADQGAGHYLYVDSSVPHGENDTARLISKVYKPDDEMYCLHFAYHMHGDPVGKLNVYAVPSSWMEKLSQLPLPWPNPIWTISGEQGQDWQYTEVQFQEPTDFQVVFEAVPGASDKSDIAIDDVAVSRGLCNVQFRCDFESFADSTCGFLDHPISDINWTVANGFVSAGNTGPDADHTYGPDAIIPGHYMYVDISGPQTPGNKAVMVKQLTASAHHTERCLRFYYHMHSQDVGTLKVLVGEDVLTAWLSAPIWTVSGDQGNEWKRAAITVPVEREFQLILEAVVTGSGDQTTEGSIAIDDIEVTDGACQPGSATTTTTVSSTTGQSVTYAQVPGWLLLRLVDGTATAGRLEVDIHGERYLVCRDGFTEAAAAIVCRELGQTGGDPGILPAGAYSQSLDPLDLLLGSDLLIGQYATCSLNGGSLDCQPTTCSSKQTLALSCDSDAVQPVVFHLVDGTTTAGRLEVHINGQTYKVCRAGFTDHSAAVVCQAMGHTGGNPGVLPEGTFSNTEHEVFAACSLNGNAFDCHPSDCGATDLAISCDTSGGRFPIRLVGGSSQYEGRLEIFYNGQWGTVCDDSFHGSTGLHNAIVACRQLGFDVANPTYFSSDYFGHGSGPIYMDEVRCLGNEAELADCPFDGFGHHDCSHSEDVGIRCAVVAVQSRHPVRLVDGPRPSEGRVEIWVNGAWGTVCDDDWDHYAAVVVCRQLGYDMSHTNPLYYGHARYGRGTGPIHLDDFNCNGREAELADCRNNGFDNHDCDHSEDAGVNCSP